MLVKRVDVAKRQRQVQSYVCKSIRKRMRHFNRLLYATVAQLCQWIVTACVCVCVRAALKRPYAKAVFFHETRRMCAFGCMHACVCVSAVGGATRGLRGRVMLSPLECMTAMFCHRADECSVMAAEEEGGEGEERKRRKEYVAGGEEKRTSIFFFFFFSPHSMRKLGHPSKAIAGNKSSS